MFHATRLWTATLAVAGLMTLPLTVAAQSSEAQAGQYGEQTSTSPSNHLDQAKKVLDRIDDSTLTGSTASSVQELKQNFEQLRSAYNSASGSMSGTSGTSGTSGSTPSGDWKQSFSKIQQSLDQLNVPKSSAWMPITGGTGTSGTGTSGTSGTGTSGTGTTGSGNISSGSSIDPSVMSDLKEFRRHVEEFYKVASSK